MRNDIGIHPTDGSALAVQANINNAFQRLSSQRRISTEQNGAHEVKAQEVDLRSVFERISQAAEIFKSQQLDRKELAGHMRELALKLQSDMSQAQYDSHVLYTAQSGLQEASEVLIEMQEKIHGALNDVFSQNKESMAKIHHHLENISKKLNIIQETKQFDGQALFQNPELSVHIGTTTTQEVPLNLPNLTENKIEIPENLDTDSLQRLAHQVDDQLFMFQGESSRIEALNQRLNLRTKEISTANDQLMSLGLQLRDLPEARETSEVVGKHIRKGHFSSTG